MSNVKVDKKYRLTFMVQYNERDEVIAADLAFTRNTSGSMAFAAPLVSTADPSVHKTLSPWVQYITDYNKNTRSDFLDCFAIWSQSEDVRYHILQRLRFWALDQPVESFGYTHYQIFVRNLTCADKPSDTFQAVVDLLYWAVEDLAT